MMSNICSECNKEFKKFSRLQRHINETHLNLKTFECQICNNKYKRNSHLKRHLLSHSENPKPFICDFKNCLMSFSNKHHLERHQKVKHLNGKNECEECHLFFVKKCFLLKHKIDNHNFPVPFKCEFCSNGFLNSQKLKIHTDKCHFYLQGLFFI